MLEIKALSCGYGPKTVITGIDLGVKAQEFFGIIGPNGSGKTTLLRAMARTIKPMAGQIILDGKDLWEIPLEDFALRCAVVSQYLPSVAMTVEEYVLLGRIPHFKPWQFSETKEDLQAAREAMELTGISTLMDKSILHLSSGERQLAQMARALAQRPALLLLDEPTAHLDIAHQVDILDLLKKLIRQINLTVVVVLHDLNLASEYCDCLGLMSEGKLYKLGTPREVIDYQIIEKVYKTVVVVEENPISSKPYVLIVPQEELLKNKHKNKNSV
jgi:iron complex transport system ATP-binding protein